MEATRRIPDERHALAESCVALARREAWRARKRWPWLDQDDTESVSLEAVAKAARDHRPERGEMTTAATRYARNALVSLARARAGRWKREQRAVDRHRWEAMRAVVPPEGDGDAQEAARLAGIVLAAVGEKESEILRLRWLEGRTFQGCGDILGLTRAGANHRASAALAKARAALEEAGEGD